MLLTRLRIVWSLTQFPYLPSSPLSPFQNSLKNLLIIKILFPFDNQEFFLYL